MQIIYGLLTIGMWTGLPLAFFAPDWLTFPILEWRIAIGATFSIACAFLLWLLHTVDNK